MRDRVGRFRIALEVIEREPSTVLAVLAGIIVLRAECLFFQGVIEYTGVADAFSKTPQGQEVPLYRATFNPDGTVRWERES